MDIFTDERIELMTGSVWNIQETEVTTGRLSCTGLGKHPRTDDWIRNVTIRYRRPWRFGPSTIVTRRVTGDWTVDPTRRKMDRSGDDDGSDGYGVISCDADETGTERKRRNSAFRPTRWRWRPPVVRRMAHTAIEPICDVLWRDWSVCMSVDSTRRETFISTPYDGQAWQSHVMFITRIERRQRCTTGHSSFNDNGRYCMASRGVFRKKLIQTSLRKCPSINPDSTKMTHAIDNVIAKTDNAKPIWTTEDNVL